MKNKVYKNLIVSAVFGLIIITSASIFTIAYASGMRVDFKNLTLYKVGIIYVESSPKASIYSNNQEIGATTPKAINLRPGSYQISVRKQGYHSFEKYINLESGGFYEAKDILLFKNEPEVKTLSANSPQIDSSLTTDKDPYIHDNHEIWYEQKLVTRLMTDVLSVAAINKNYLIYQTATGINIICSDGTNNIQFVKMTDKRLAQIRIIAYSKTIEVNFPDITYSISYRN